MIVLKTQARPYANALFELASEENTCESWHKILATLSVVIDNAEVRVMLKIRSIEPKEWVTWIQSLKPDLLEKKEVGNLLLLLAEKRRLFLMPEIYKFFEAEWRRSKNEKRFTVMVPTKWGKAQSQDFSHFLSKRFSCKAGVNFETHPEMLGGIEVVGEGWRLDYSVKGWLAQLRSQLSG
jgi:F-type H+-transporting ATPase subunit delta